LRNCAARLTFLASRARARAFRPTIAGHQTNARRPRRAETTARRPGGARPDTDMTRAPSAQTPHRIALLFNANKVYDREIISGIGQYLHTTRVVWDLFLEDDFRCRLAGIERFDGDGIIADFDDPAVADALAGSPLPVVALGSSYEDPAQYPQDVPYIATDNPKLVSLAYTHLIGAGSRTSRCTACRPRRRTAGRSSANSRSTASRAPTASMRRSTAACRRAHRAGITRSSS
jgi:DNA-binding LacI/PurR family transcriptional regulator